MKVLIVGGTGTVGSQVTRELLERGVQVRVMTRSAEKARALPAGAEGLIGDLDSAADIFPWFDDVDGVFLNLALSPNESQQGLAAVEAIRGSRVQRLVYLSVHNLEAGGHIPHFKTKVPIEKAIKESGIPYVILRPNNFYQNDLALKEAITKYGVYPQPLGKVGLNRVDIRDIAAAAANAFLDGKDGVYPLVGPDVWTGESTARCYSKHLGREVRYAGDNLDAFAQQASQFLPAWMIHDLRIMYEYFQKEGLLASEADLAQQQKILRRAPRSFDAFVEEMAASWKS
jgi:uncharacterized protein YbjT (DUF2867 family)